MATIAGERLAAVDRYIETSAEFARPVLEFLRGVIREGAPGVAEEMKWSRPFFVYKGVILGNVSGFKAHCSFGLWGKEIGTTLCEDGVAKEGGMGTFGRITSVKDLPGRKQMVQYVRQAAHAIDEGTRTKAWSRPRVAKAEAVVPEALAAGLKKHKAAARAWESMSPGCRREYCAWVTEAKREETRGKRVATALEWIAEGKGRNSKYEIQGTGGRG